MHPENKTFVTEIPVNDPQAMEQFQQSMDAYHDELNRYICDLARTLNVPEACAMDVWYLRTRSRWTPELEDRLIQLHLKGEPPNVCDFG